MQGDRINETPLNSRPGSPIAPSQEALTPEEDMATNVNNDNGEPAETAAPHPIFVPCLPQRLTYMDDVATMREAVWLVIEVDEVNLNTTHGMAPLNGL